MAVVIAGGTSGIGFLLARRLAVTDETLVLGYHGDPRRAARCETVLRAAGRTAATCRADLGTRAGAEELVARVHETGEPVTRLVHSVVSVETGPLVEADEALVHRTLAVNGLSLLWLVRAAGELMLAGSSVLYVSSEGARRVGRGYGLIGPAKALGDAYVRQLAVELAPRGVRVNAMSPGLYDTPAMRRYLGEGWQKAYERAQRRSPSGRMIGEDDLVGVAEFLLGSASAGVTGQVVDVQNGSDLVV